MRDEISTQLANYIAAEILRQPERVIKRDEALISTGLVDSFSLVDLSLFVESTFGVRIEDTELNKDTFDTINDLSEIIRQRQI
jgi:acyl carrier protein